LDNDTTGAACGVGDATLLLDLDGLAVQSVERSEAGSRLVRLATVDETAAACPVYGVISTRVKEYVCTRPRDLPQGRVRVELTWRKRRWYCREPLCARLSFTESVPAVPAGARITTRLRAHAGDLVVDGVCATVAAAGRVTGVSCPRPWMRSAARPRPSWTTSRVWLRCWALMRSAGAVLDGVPPSQVRRRHPYQPPPNPLLPNLLALNLLAPPLQMDQDSRTDPREGQP
jgi:hypothetical protein